MKNPAYLVRTLHWVFIVLLSASLALGAMISVFIIIDGINVGRVAHLIGNQTGCLWTVSNTTVEAIGNVSCNKYFAMSVLSILMFGGISVIITWGGMMEVYMRWKERSGLIIDLIENPVLDKEIVMKTAKRHMFQAIYAALYIVLWILLSLESGIAYFYYGMMHEIFGVTSNIQTLHDMGILSLGEILLKAMTAIFSIYYISALFILYMVLSKEKKKRNIGSIYKANTNNG